MFDAASVYGPPGAVLRFTRWLVAFVAAGHVSFTCLSPPTALRLTGADGGAEQESIARLTFSRPPEMVDVAIDAMTSTESTRVAFNSAVSRTQCDSASAPAPDTCGAAIDVPLKNAYAFPRIVDSTS